MRHKKEHHMEREMRHPAHKHIETARKHIEKAEIATKKALGMHHEGGIMKLRDRHEPRATEHGIREKRKYTKRK